MAKKPETKPAAKEDPKKKGATAVTKAIVPTPQKAITKAPPAFEEDAGQNNIGRDDMTVPRLVVLQALSPQLQKSKPEYIKGAEVGDLCHTGTNEVWSGEEGVIVLPVAYRRTHIEWKPREKGGGFVKDHGPDGNILKSCTLDERTNRQTLVNGNHIQVTAEYYVFILEEGKDPQPVMMSMAGVQLKKSRRWNTLISTLQVPRQSGEGTFNPAMFYRSYLVKTVPNSNDKGDWFEWEIAGDKDVTQLENGNELYLIGKALKEAIGSGKVKGADPRANDEFGEHGGAVPPEDSSAM